MPPQPKVSVLVPVYNRGPVIERCIASGLAQTHANLEVVVIDNASSDDTWQVVRRLASADRRILAFRNETNLGPTRNWIRGLERCTGEYVKVLWSDDTIEADFLSSAVSLLEAHRDVHLVFTSASVHSADGSEVFFHYPGKQWFEPREYIRRTILRDNLPVSPGCALVRRSQAHFRLPIGASAELNEIAERYGAGPDVLFLLEAAAASTRVAHVPRVLSHFYATGSSITVNYREPVERGYRLAFDVFLSERGEQLGLGRLKQRLAWRRFRRAIKVALRRLTGRAA